MQRYTLMVICITVVVTITARQHKKNIPSQKLLLQQLKTYEVVHVDLAGLSRSFHLLTHDAHLDHHIGASPEVLHQFSFSIKDRKLNATVSLHHELFAKDYREEQHTYKDGKRLHIKHKKYDSQSCQYTGFLHDSEEARIDDSIISVNNCPHGYLSGIIRTDEAYAIVPAHDYFPEAQLQVHARRLQAKHDSNNVNLHLVYKLSDFKDEIFTGSEWCGVGLIREGNESTTPGIHDQHHNHNHRQLGDPFSSSYDNPKQTAHGRKLSDIRRVGLLIVNDFKRTKLSNNNPEISSASIVDLVETLYNGFSPKVKFQLVGQISFRRENPFNVTYNQKGEALAEIFLSNFHKWRMIPGAVALDHDNAHLLSGEDFEDEIVGFAGLGTMCQLSNSGGIDMTFDVQSQTPFSINFAASVLAHEIGHNFGMQHDGTENSCATSGSIMSAYVDPIPPEEFSSCSHSYYHNFVKQSSRNACLLDREPTTWGEPNCGNGYVEAGEECDCGDECKYDPCCDGTSCRLLPQKQCSELDPCCSECKISKINVVCRQAATFCDLEEYCDGVHSTCPPNYFKGSGTPCNDETYGNGLCYGGFCQSKSRQCSELSPPDTIWTECSIDMSFSLNTCGDLTCGDAGGNGCGPITGNTPNKNIQIADGVKCSKDNEQCYEGVCQHSNHLNPNHKWHAGAYSDCSSCDQPQLRTIDCVSIDLSGKVTICDNGLCSPDINLPFARKCFSPVNSSVLCVHRDNLAEQYALEFAKRFNSLNKADFFRSLTPRFYGSSDFSPSDPTYRDGILSLSIIPFIFLLLCLVYFCYYNATGKGCGKGSYQDYHQICPDNTLWVVLPVLCLLIVLIFTFMTAIIGIICNLELKNGITGTNGVLDTSKEVVSQLPIQIEAMKRPLKKINETFYLDDGKLLREIIHELDVCFLPFQTQVEKVKKNIADAITLNKKMINFKTNGTKVECVVCPLMSANLTSLQNIFTSRGMMGSSITNNIQDVRQYVSSLERNINSNIISSILATLTEFETHVKKNGEKVLDYGEWIKETEKLRFPFIFILVIIPSIVVLMTFLVMVFKKESRFKLLKYCGWFILLISWLLLAIHLPLTHTFGDSCEFLNKLEQDPIKVMNFNRIESTVFTTCLVDGTASLLTPLNLTNEVALLNTLPSSDFKLPEMDTRMNTSVIIVDDLKKFSEDLKLNFNGSNNDPNATELAHKYVHEFNENLIVLYENIKSLHILYYGVNITANHDELVELGDAGKALSDSAKCGSIGDRYAELKTVSCNVVTPAITLLTFSFFLTALISIPFIYLLGVKRDELHEGAGHEKLDEDTDENEKPAASNPIEKNIVEAEIDDVKADVSL